MGTPDEDEEILAALSKRFDDAQKTLASPPVEPVGSDSWRIDTIKKQSAIQIMLLDERLSRMDRDRLSSTYEYQQRNMDELARQEERNWQMEMRTKEIELETQYRVRTFEHADASRALSESQLELGRQTKESSDALGKSLSRATWVLAGATIALVLATVALIVVTALHSG